MSEVTAEDHLINDPRQIEARAVSRIFSVLGIEADYQPLDLGNTVERLSRLVFLAEGHIICDEDIEQLDNGGSSLSDNILEAFANFATDRDTLIAYHDNVTSDPCYHPAAKEIGEYSGIGIYASIRRLNHLLRNRVISETDVGLAHEDLNYLRLRIWVEDVVVKAPVSTAFMEERFNSIRRFFRRDISDRIENYGFVSDEVKALAVKAGESGKDWDSLFRWQREYDAEYQ